MNWIKLIVAHQIKIPHVDESFGVGRHQERKGTAHQMNWLTKPRLTNLLQLISLDPPKLYEAVPTSGNQERLTIRRKRIDVFYRGIMFPNSVNLLLLDIPSLNGPVGTCQKDHILVSLPADSQNRAFDLLGL